MHACRTQLRIHALMLSQPEQAAWARQASSERVAWMSDAAVQALGQELGQDPDLNMEQRSHLVDAAQHAITLLQVWRWMERYLCLGLKARLKARPLPPKRFRV